MMRTRLIALLLTLIAPIDAFSMKAGNQATPIKRIKVAKGFKVELLSQNRNGRQSRVSGKALAAGSSAVQYTLLCRIIHEIKLGFCNGFDATTL